MRTSQYACPSCGEHQLYYPAVKGEYGTYDTSKYACYSCGKEFSSKEVREKNLPKRGGSMSLCPYCGHVACMCSSTANSAPPTGTPEP